MQHKWLRCNLKRCSLVEMQRVFGFYGLGLKCVELHECLLLKGVADYLCWH